MRKRYLIVPIVALCITSNVHAITSNEVTYDNEGTIENLTDTLDTLYSELKEYKTGGSVQANQMLEGATGYSKGELVTGTIKSKGATTYTPGTSNQTIGAGQYLSGAQTIKGDANLVAGNIAAGKSIFGVSGTFTSDANAVAADILSGKTAYVNGSKITGTIGSKGATTYTPGTSNQTISSGQYLSGVQTIKGDANLKAENIKSGVNIFGVTGTMTASDMDYYALQLVSVKPASDVECLISNSSNISQDGLFFVGFSASLGKQANDEYKLAERWTYYVKVNGLYQDDIKNVVYGDRGMVTWILPVRAGDSVEWFQSVAPSGLSYHNCTASVYLVR